MTEQEIKAIEENISRLDVAISTLTGDKTNIEYQIAELKNIKAALTRLLPPDNRINRLFKD